MTIVKAPTNDLPRKDDQVTRGQWYWVTFSDGPALGCVTHIGSNYTKITFSNTSDVRIHDDEFWKRCTLELDPEGYFNTRIQEGQDKVRRLMNDVKQLTSRLALNPLELTAGNEGQALARIDSGTSSTEYKTALILAKEETLPKLFQEIRDAQERVATLMKAALIPLKAEADSLKGVTETIQDRLFNVELYAGLTEQMVQIADGEPAAVDAKIHLMQRRCYMDEECLVGYRAGGMDFNDLDQFDQWLATPKNRDRLLPFPRTVVSFQVRRNSKQHRFQSLQQFIRFSMEDEGFSDKLTYLYIRNGDKLYRMSTSVHFGSKLFPNMEEVFAQKTEPMWAKFFSYRLDVLIPDRQYQEMRKEYAAELREWRAKMKERKAAKARGEDVSRISHRRPDSPIRGFSRYDLNNVFYDDINQHIEGKLKKHNHIALVLQGILDRSPACHPHPPWRIYTAEGFSQAFELIYDQSKALAPAHCPDFEAYRARLNQTLKVGSITVGQEDVWLRAMATKENERRSREYRRRWEDHRDLKIYRPNGDPGPGLLARVTSCSKSNVGYSWQRERLRYSSNESLIPSSIKVGKDLVLNIDDYKPGDYLQFFEDPRTRKDYLMWAPLLLVAEDYYAGEQDIGSPSTRSYELDFGDDTSSNDDDD